MNDKNKNTLNFYGNIITKIAIVFFLILWNQVDRRLQRLEGRLRGLELQVTAISNRLGVEPVKSMLGKLSSPQGRSDRPVLSDSAPIGRQYIRQANNGL